ncbi:GNAT family N-acetyltransferase [Nakamurella lactea]|uniref:GNAT family N-acetyltransferase n=1 Tax=Nakamurella lactea TaxID=459515 RepID=UPI0003FCACA1|nr:GNAT family N-acetyltransferase [Nakamurella lactea]
MTINRVAQRHWHALDDDRVVGRGEAFRRPDRRIFLSIDAWHGAVFDQLATVMLPDLPRPLFTVVDEADHELTSHWRRAGFQIRGREYEYRVPTDPRLTGLSAAPLPPGLTTLGFGAAAPEPLGALDRVIRAEIEAGVGWQQMPAEVMHRPDGTALDPSRFAVAVHRGDYVALLRLTPVRQPRIGLIAVTADLRRRGIARALLASVLGSLHRSGIPIASADVNESNTAAVALFDGIGAVPQSSNLELVLR